MRRWADDGSQVAALCLLPRSLVLLSLFLFFPRPSLAVPIDNGLVGSQLVQECVARSRVDLAVLLDGSGSIGDLGFEEQKNFLNFILEELDIRPNATQVSVVQFSDEPRLELRFGAQTQKLLLQGAVARIPYLTGTTMTGQALEFTRKFAFADARGNGVPKVLLVLTDGQSQDQVATAAEALRREEVLIFAIGITDLIDARQLGEIAGSPSRVFTVESYEALSKPLSKLIVSHINGAGSKRRSLISELNSYHLVPGEAEIICESSGIGVRARSKRPFEGHIFVKNHYNDPECRRSATELPSDTELSLTIPLTSCNLEPRGVYMETTVVFMFHEWFMTKVDQAVRIQCFYMEADKTVTVPLEVSMLTTELAERTYPMPRCYYSLRSGSPEGPHVQFAAIGDKVYHRWECIEHEPRYDIFGMLVHDCIVDDSNGDVVSLIDFDGCGSDLHLVGTPEYEQSLRVAIRETHVFKYADRPVLEFQCQITICYKHDGSCDGLTPPVCEEPRARRKRTSSMEEGRRTLDVIAPPFTVIDTLFPTPPSPLLSESMKRVGEGCDNAWILVYILGAALVILAFTLLILCFCHPSVSRDPK